MNRNLDLAAVSYFIEGLTEEFVEKAGSKFQKLETI